MGDLDFTEADLLGRAGRLFEAPLEPGAVLAEITALPVPEFADLTVVDRLDGEGRLYGAVTCAADAHLAEALREARALEPIDPEGDHPAAVAARTGESQLLADLSERELQRFAGGAFARAVSEGAQVRSGIFVPLIARGRTRGVLCFARLGAREAFDEAAVELAEDLAERAAMVLDNAELFEELRSAESRLEAILGSIDEAVSAFAPDGSYVFANEAAARMVGARSIAELMQRNVDQLLTPWMLLDDRGRPVDPAAMPVARALAGERPEPVILHVISKETGADRWVISRAEPVFDENGDLELVVTVTEDVTAVKREEARQRLLASATKLVTSSLDVHATVEKAAWAAVPELADWARIDLPDEYGQLHEAAVAHHDLGKLELLREWRARYPPDPADLRGPAEVLRTGRSVVWDQVQPADIERYARDERHAQFMRVIDTRSVLIVPLQTGDRVIGTLELATTGDSGRRLTRGDLELAEDLGARAAIAVEHARLHEALSHIAATLQRALAPPPAPRIPGLSIAVRFRAAGLQELQPEGGFSPAGVGPRVGGDFYDFFHGAGGWMVVVGDVTGKGPEAAAVTSIARYTLRTAAMYENEPDLVLARLNDALVSNPDHRQLCTAVCVFVEPHENGTRLIVSCAGHPPPLRVAADGSVAPVGQVGTLLGAFEDGHWRADAVDLAQGESLVLYTDGVTDTRGTEERFGQERLAEVLERLGPVDAETLAGGVDGALLEFEAGAQRDDVALLVLRATPLAGPARPRERGLRRATSRFRPQRAG